MEHTEKDTAIMSRAELVAERDGYKRMCERLGKELGKAIQMNLDLMAEKHAWIMSNLESGDAA